ncbi:Uu.00g056710.m01.CDS01 [Anthostomella pinea]|uniref:Uu.00g056710.m01.CDS01 n=1 Tax=Anthostomella pinea TaxID=933095 RepID=A0AAI8VRL1_9PEZI|nr:Uu.00g056710.m01.CDS01 [Anthostomella pinea]
MAVATPPTHQQTRRLAPGLSPATARLKYHVDLDETCRRQAFKHNRVTQQLKLNSRVNHMTRQRKASTPRQRWAHEDEDNHRLARDRTIALPGDGTGNKPRLQRQEAFRAPSSSSSAWLYTEMVDDDDADLYHLGLLYDDEQAGFGLDAIAHSDPVYALRPANPARKRCVGRLESNAPGLAPDTFASLDGYMEIARYTAPDLDEISFLDTEAGHDGGVAPVEGDPSGLLSIIYELVESSIRSLVSSPTACDFPDLIHDAVNEEIEDEEEYADDDWALVSKAANSSHIAAAAVNAQCPPRPTTPESYC